MFTGSQPWELLQHVHTSDMTHNPLRGSRYIGCLNLSTSSSSSTFFMAVGERLHSPRRLRNYSNTSDATRDVVIVFAHNTKRHFPCWWPPPLSHYLSVPEISSISYTFSIVSIALRAKGGHSCSDSNLGVKSSSAGPPRIIEMSKQRAPLALTVQMLLKLADCLSLTLSRNDHITFSMSTILAVSHHIVNLRIKLSCVL